MNQPEIKPIIDKAKILVEALPYIQKFNGKTVVIKYGGNAMINDELKNKVMEDITLLKYIGINPIVVHGGGPDISKALKKFDIESEFINGLRVTDEETMNVARMVLIGKTNKEIVSLLGTKGGKGLGISGIDGKLIECKKYYTDVDGKKTDIGYVGEIVNINEKVLDIMTSDDYIPVVAPIGVDKDGNSYNINADTVAGAETLEQRDYGNGEGGAVSQMSTYRRQLRETEKTDDLSLADGRRESVIAHNMSGKFNFLSVPRAEDGGLSQTMPMYLNNYLGKYICLDLWTCEKVRIEKCGILTDVGADFIAIQNVRSGNRTIIDLRTIRYVSIFCR